MLFADTSRQLLIIFSAYNMLQVLACILCPEEH